MITAATAVEVAVIGVVLAAGIGPLDLVGVTAAAAAILAGRVAGTSTCGPGRARAPTWRNRSRCDFRHCHRAAVPSATAAA